MKDRWESAYLPPELNSAITLVVKTQINNLETLCWHCGEVIPADADHIFEAQNIFKEDRLVSILINIKCIACSVERGGELVPMELND